MSRPALAFLLGFTLMLGAAPLLPRKAESLLNSAVAIVVIATVLIVGWKRTFR